MSDSIDTSNDFYKPIKIIKLTTDGNINPEIHVDGTNNYEDLENKPSIEGCILIGDKSLDELGITPENMNVTAESLGITAETLGITPEDLGIQPAGAFKVAELFN